MPEAGCGGGGGMSSKEKLESNAKSPTGTRVTSEEGRDCWGKEAVTPGGDSESGHGMVCCLL